jgi:hypothetical protein
MREGQGSTLCILPYPGRKIAGQGGGDRNLRVKRPLIIWFSSTGPIRTSFLNYLHFLRASG